MKRSSDVYEITVGELIEMIDKGHICVNLYAENTDMQRNEVWSMDTKSKFVDTLINTNLAVPVMVFVEDKGIYMVLDGKQRVTTILNFINNQFRLNKNISYKNLIGYKFSKLPEEYKSNIMNKKLLFLNTPFVSDEQSLELFHRFNSGEKLNAVEGWRVKLHDKLPFLTEMTKLEAFKYFGLTKTQLNRFGDLEVALDLVLEQIEPGCDHNKCAKKTFALSEAFEGFSDKFKSNVLNKIEFMAETLSLGSDIKVETIIKTGKNKGNKKRKKL